MASAKGNKGLREVVRMVEEFTRDHEISITGSNHLRIVVQRGGDSRTVFAPGTPSDKRSFENVRAKLRRAFREMAPAAA